MKSLIPLLGAVAATLLLSSCGKGDPQPRIVSQTLVAVDSPTSHYVVQGTVQNPTKHPMKDVKICYRVWGKLKGSLEGGIAASSRRTGDAAYATIKTLAPGETVDFTAVASPPVPNYPSAKPDPLKAEITAAWAD